ncbi:MAG TPA: hypothetical protein VFU58_07260 [Candidatus Nitrosotalea sp.]|nr:hypothetical protein [Candidatus Nitrosotalea sp.]
MKTLYLSIIIISLVIFGTLSNASGIPTTESKIQLLTGKPTYVPGEKIQIIGAFSPNDLIHIDLVNPFDGTKNSTLLQSDNTGHFRTNYVVPYNAVNGTWKILATSGLSHANLEIQVISSNYAIKNENTATASPLQQFKSGVVTQNITCKEGLVLAIKKQGHHPACVNPDTIPKLVLRGWSENPLDSLLLKYENQTQANLVFYDILNEPKIRDWSMKGWRYSDYSYASNGETHQSSATVRLYLPSNIGKHECENGSYGFVVINLKPVEIIHNYTEVGCEIVTTTAKLVDPQSNGR